MSTISDLPKMLKAKSKTPMTSEQSGVVLESLKQDDLQEHSNTVVDRVFKLRQNFVIIGLTGRTGSGCTTVAEKLSTKEWFDLKSNYQDVNPGPIDNEVRKNRIVHRF